MTQYTTLLQELQSHKRQVTSLRKKCITLQSDNIILKESEHAIKLALQTLKQTAGRLERTNESLQKQNQRLTKQYQNQFLTLKSQIDKKQDNMKELQIAMQNNVINMGLVRRQVQCQVQSKFMQQIQKKDQKFNQLQAKFDVIKRQKQVDKEKYNIKIKSLEAALQEAETRHLQEVKDYANKLYQQSQKKVTNSQDSMLKRLRRQLDCVRNMINEKDSQIQTLLAQKSQLLQQNTILTSSHQKSNQQLLTQLTDYKRNIDQHKNLQYQQQTRQQNSQIRTIQRQLKRTKQQLTQLKQQLQHKQNRIQELKTQIKQTQQQLQNIQTKTKKKYEQKMQQLQQNSIKLQKQMRQLKSQQQYYKNKYNAIVATAVNNKQAYFQNDVLNYRNKNKRQNKNYRQEDYADDRDVRKQDRHYTNKNTQNRENIRQNIDTNVNDKNITHITNTNTRQNQQITNKNKKQEQNIQNSQKNVTKKYITNQENIIQEKNVKNIKKIYNQVNDDFEDRRSKRKSVRSDRDFQQMEHYQSNNKRNIRNIRKYQDDQQYETDIRNKKQKNKRNKEQLYEDDNKREQSPIENFRIQRQRDKVRQLARKYIQLQKKYDKCKKKLDQANQKVLQLIRNKIAMVSPPKTINEGINIINSHGKTDPQAYSNVKYGQKTKQQKNKLKQMISSAGQHFYRSTSPKHNKFYEKSLSFKSKNKTKDLRCINHDHQDEAEHDCEHQHTHKH